LYFGGLGLSSSYSESASINAPLCFDITALEIESAASLIKSSAKMKANIQNEAENLNYFPKSAKLPLSDNE
jgi:hypothetical protein